MDADAPRSPISPEDLDRLADGVLSDAERRALLARLDGEPDAWRRCALAFLEAQAWREALGAMATPPNRAATTRPNPHRGRPGARLAPFALAAGLIGAAFLLGRATGGLPGSVSIADRPGAVLPLAESSSADGPAAGPSELLGPSGPDVAAPIVADPWGEGIRTVGYLNLPTDADPEAPVVEVPVLAGPGIDDRWLRDQPSFIPEDLRRDWQRLGYEVESQRKLVSVQLGEDGHYLTIPVDEVLLRAVERPTY